MLLGANTTITTYRLVNAGNTSAFSGTATIDGQEAYIESQEADVAAVLESQPGVEVFLLHMEPGDIRPSDKVVDADSLEYRVMGVEKHEGNDDVDDHYICRLHKTTKWHSD